MNALRKKSNSFIKKFKSSSVHKQLKSLSKFFEEIAFDKLLWWLRHYWSNKKYENTVKDKNADFSQLRMVSNKLEETGNALQYGRPLTPYQKDRIIQLEKAGVSMSDIKIIVSSQYINKDGSIRARGLRDGVALVASWTQLLLIFISFLLIGLLIWLSSISLLWKSLLSILYFSFFLFAGHIYRTIGIRSWKVYSIVEEKLLTE